MQLRIDGELYEMVDVGTLNLDESCWFYDIAGVGIEALDSDAFNPRIVKALVCLSVARAKPEVSQKEIEQAVGKQSLLDLGKAFEEAAAESPPDERPPSETGAEPETSGEPSNGAGDGSPEGNGQSSTGMPASGTGAISLPLTSSG